MSIHTHFSTLQEKHTKLDAMIAQEAHRPLPDFSSIQLWKKQKLLFKEEMERIREVYGTRAGDVA